MARLGNTHSPVVVARVPDDSLLFADVQDAILDGSRYSRVRFRPTGDTWRAAVPDSPEPVAKGEAIEYLLAASAGTPDNLSALTGPALTSPASRTHRLIDRPDYRP